jgi:hypothetical protein
MNYLMKNIFKPTPKPKPLPPQGPPMSTNPFDGITGERPPWWTPEHKTPPISERRSV